MKLSYKELSRKELYSLQGKYIFHGSPTLFNICKPHQAECETRNADNEKFAIYGTNSLNFAILFSFKKSPTENFSWKTAFNGTDYYAELYNPTYIEDNAFGYIYCFNKKHFKATQQGGVQYYCYKKLKPKEIFKVYYKDYKDLFITKKYNVKYSGKIIQVAEEMITLPNGKTKIFEYALRSPGVRAIIVKDNKMLLSNEYRNELKTYDYRLPGGKVFDSLTEYVNNNSNLTTLAKKAVIKECFEEVGIQASSPKLLQISKAGATVIWDLFYFEITKFKTTSQHLEDGEIINYNWYTFKQVKEMCLNGMISEDRSVAVILKYLLNQKTKKPKTTNKLNK